MPDLLSTESSRARAASARAAPSFALLATAALASACALQHAPGVRPQQPRRDVVEPPGPDASSECDPATQMLCGAACANVQTDPHHCGSCARDCTTLPNVTADMTRCVDGACVITNACPARYGDCDDDPLTGCEVDLSEASHCGACGAACTAGQACALDMAGEPPRYRCVSNCPGGTTLCGGSCANLNTDGANCGTCGTVCTPPPDSRSECAMGRCTFACNAGFHRCASPEHCAADESITECGDACAACATPNGTPACVMGACAVATCMPGFGDCDGNAANGCETMTNSATHCGACGNTCTAPAGATAVCTRGLCDYTCPTGMVRTATGCGPAGGMACGNRVLDTGEQCDDGNAVAGDGCNACRLEWTPAAGCPPSGQVIRVAAGGAQIYLGTTAGAGASMFTCPSGIGGIAGDRAYNVTALAAGTLRIELNPDPGYDAVLIVRPSCTGTTTFCQDNARDASATEVVSFPVTAGTNVVVIADGYRGSTGAFRLQFTLM